MISYGKHYIDKKDLKSVSNTLNSNWLTQGPKVKTFEDPLTEVIALESIPPVQDSAVDILSLFFFKSLIIF